LHLKGLLKHQNNKEIIILNRQLVNNS